MELLSGLEVGEITDENALASLDEFINACTNDVA
jgi:hypothetical protein